MKKLIPTIWFLLTAPLFAGVSNLVFVAFDVETTGLSPAKERIIEIGAAKYRDGKIIDSAHWLINPGIPIPNTYVHGISNQDVAEKPSFTETYPLFCAFVGESTLLAHNATFDVRFMSAEMERNQLTPLPNPTINTLTLFRHWYPHAPSHKLGELSRHLNLPISVEHRAKDDSELLLRIFCHGLESRPNATLDTIKSTANGTYYFDGSRKK